jgi:ribosome-associated protein
MLDLRQRCAFADYFVLCTGASERQIKAILEGVDQALTEAGAVLLRQEGSSDSGWILLDFGDVIVHIFAPWERDYYRLEQAWSHATPVLRIQ